MRKPGTTRVGNNFDAATIQAVWEKGIRIALMDPKIWRRDSCHAMIKRTEHGNTASSVGWEIDHIKPLASGGDDDLNNLQPLQWENNRVKGDSWPNWLCKNKG